MHPRQSSPAALRNRGPILAVLRRILPERARVLEVAAGSGEHAAYFAAAEPGWFWLPTDPDTASRASIASWCADLSNVAPPLQLDVMAHSWPREAEPGFDAVVAINMIHIAPWAATPALFAGASRALKPGGVVFLYGPFKRDGRHTAASNEAFDAWLAARDPRFGVRDLGAVQGAAEQQGFRLSEIAEMPANNFSVIFCNRHPSVAGQD